MDPERRWERNRSWFGLLEVAEMAIDTMIAITPEGNMVLVDKLHELRGVLAEAKQRGMVDLHEPRTNAPRAK